MGWATPYIEKLFDDRLEKTFYGWARPTSDRFVPEALAVSGFSREQHMAFEDPKAIMENFATWLGEQTKGRPIFVSDNLAFDWQFINYYFHRSLARNPFGFSGRRIGDLYAGLVKDASKATECVWDSMRQSLSDRARSSRPQPDKNPPKMISDRYNYPTCSPLRFAI